jgi:hypothetical protein
MQLLPITPKYKYPSLTRIDGPNGRTYSLDGGPPVPSVTAILSATKEGKNLADWEERVGSEEASRIKNEAATVGTHMHNVIERLLLNRPLETPRNYLQVKGYRMGYLLIETFFPRMDQVWGSEVPLLYPGRYAGTSDLVGIYRGEICIVDFKQTNKMKQRKWIEDYFLQLAAYAEAHNMYHGTRINQGVILMVDQDGQTQEFMSCGREFENYKTQWMRRVEQFEKKPVEVTPPANLFPQGDN